MLARLLRVFVAVSKGDLGQAAKGPLVSQPSLSQDIRRLERELRTQLFVRGSHGVTLTPAGEEFRRDIEDALALLDRAVEHAERRQGQQTTRRARVQPEHGAGAAMSTLLPLVELRLPAIVVDDCEADTGAVASGVRSGTFDLGLVHCQGAEKGLTVETLRHEKLCVALAADHPLSVRGQPICLQELGDLSIMIWPREVAPDYYDTLDRDLPPGRADAGHHPRTAAGDNPLLQSVQRQRALPPPDLEFPSPGAGRELRPRRRPTCHCGPRPRAPRRGESPGGHGSLGPTPRRAAVALSVPASGCYWWLLFGSWSRGQRPPPPSQ